MAIEDSDAGSIHSKFVACFAGAGRLIAGCNNSAQDTQRHGLACLNILARLKLWGDESKAELPAMVRGSLDDVLGHNPRIRRTVMRSLSRVQRNLSICVQEIEQYPIDGSARDTEDITEELDSSTDEEELEDARPSNLRLCVRHLNQDLALLLQISLLIRQPGYERKYLHSTGGFDLSPTVASFANSDLAHVTEKLHSWRQTRKIVHREEASCAAGSAHLPDTFRDFPQDQVVLIQRLAKANTRRREQLRYWISHPDEANKVENGVINDATNLTRPDRAVIPGNTKSEMVKTRTMPESIKSRETFSTRHESNVYGTSIAGSNLQIQYEKSIMNNKRTNQVPKIPKLEEDAPFFICPYCRGTISTGRMLLRKDWKRHVLRDLRAYVCTFPDCNNPDKQYSTQQDWFNHERKMHRRQWSCAQHKLHFNMPELLISHMSEMHIGEIHPTHMQSFVALSERSTDQEIITPCPLCPEVRPLAELEGHLAEHLESIALFVLGVNLGVGEDEESSKDGSTVDTDRSTQPWSHPSQFAEGSQGSPPLYRNRSDGSADDAESDIVHRNSSDTFQDKARPDLTSSSRQPSIRGGSPRSREFHSNAQNVVTRGDVNDNAGASQLVRSFWDLWMDESEDEEDDQNETERRKERKKEEECDLQIQDLVNAGDWIEAGKVAGRGLRTASRWEHWVWKFAQVGHFDEISPYLPTKAIMPPLPSMVYEVILGWYIINDRIRFKHLLEKWDLDLFDIYSVIEAIKAKLQVGDVTENSIEGNEPGRDWRILQEALAKLQLASKEKKDLSHGDVHLGQT